MKFIIAACLIAVAVARPEYHQGSHVKDAEDHIKILRDDRHQEGGSYSFDFETENGIIRSESGSPLEHVENEPTGQQGSVSFTLPNGEHFDLKFVANEGGFQPESSHLPIAPEFPHPIPDFVLEQIEKAAKEDAEAARAESQNSYHAPPKSTYN